MGDNTSREGGQAMVGILLLETKFPQVVGDGGNPDTWPYPVVVEKAGGATPHQVVVMGLEGLLEPFVEGAKALVAKGRTASPRLAASLPSTSASWPSARACPWPPNNKMAWSRVCELRLRKHILTSLGLDALDMALGQRRPSDVVHHSDQGSQYTSIAFGARCRRAGLRPAMASVGDCYDNGMCESVFATLECELLDRHRFRSPAEARLAVFDFMEGW